jgi:hypothetical protein
MKIRISLNDPEIGEIHWQHPGTNSLLCWNGKEWVNWIELNENKS